MIDSPRIGMKVKINPNCRFADQSDQVGEIAREKPIGSGWWKVIFKDGYSNVYKKHHLILPVVSNKTDNVRYEDVDRLFKEDRLI